MNDKVSIATKPLVYSAFRYLNHKAWNALAEYVDNSIQSFIDHKDVLQKLNPNGKVTVRIVIDLNEDVITIDDNAYGIEERNFERAFELANIPLDATGLNEFGMGMKVSSIWFSDWWTLETSAYGESVKKKVIFDLNDVSKNEKLSLDVDIKPENPSSHYTKLTLTRLSTINRPSSRTIGAIKKHLTSIYIRYIRDGVLDLYVNGELLKPIEPKVLVAPYYKTPDGEPIEWTYKVDFDVPKYVNGVECGRYIARGFIGVLESMSTSEDNGILLFRRGRVIGSSGDDKYRPHQLSGSAGSPRYKRIFGELELEGFNVSFNKSSFVEDEDFYTFIDMLKDDIIASKKLDIFGQAENYRKPISQNNKKKIAKNISNALIKNSSITITPDDLKPNDSSTTEVSTNSSSNSRINTVTNTKEDSISPTLPLLPTTNSIGFDDITTTVNLYGKEYTIIIGSNYNMPNGIYSFIEIDENTYRSDLNLENPYFSRFAGTFSSDEGVNSVLSFVKAMLSSELSLIKSDFDYQSGKKFRDAFNSLIDKI